MTEQTTTAPGSVPAIHQAMARIFAEVPAIGKDAFNRDQGFHFRSVDQVMSALHGLMGKHEVFLAPEVVEFTRVNFAYTDRYSKPALRTEVDLAVKFHFVAADGSSYVIGPIRGEGRDNGDKATSKAHTMALKTLLLQVFLIATADLEDPDATTGGVDEEEPARRQRESGQRRGGQRQERREEPARSRQTAGSGSGKTDGKADGSSAGKTDGSSKADGKADGKAGSNGRGTSEITGAVTQPQQGNGQPEFVAANLTDGLELVGQVLGRTVTEDDAVDVAKHAWPDAADRVSVAELRKLRGSRLTSLLRAIHTQLRPAAELVAEDPKDGGR